MKIWTRPINIFCILFNNSTDQIIKLGYQIINLSAQCAYDADKFNEEAAKFI